MTKRISDASTVKDFVIIAEKYCSFIDTRDKFTEIETLQNSYCLLPHLCYSALHLPDIQKFKYYQRENSHSSWYEISNSLQLKFKISNNSYFDIAPYEKKAKPILASLSDDLAEIYVNIAPGIEDWDKSNPATRRGIVWEWKFLYENHWGDHAIRAFRAIHCLLFSRIDDSYGDYIGLRKIN